MDSIRLLLSLLFNKSSKIIAMNSTIEDEATEEENNWTILSDEEGFTCEEGMPVVIWRWGSTWLSRERDWGKEIEVEQRRSVIALPRKQRFATNESDVLSVDRHWPRRPTKDNKAMHPWESYWKDRCRRSPGAVHGSVRHRCSSDKWNCASVSFQKGSLFSSDIRRWCSSLARIDQLLMVLDVWYRPGRSIFPCRETDLLSGWVHIEPCPMRESLAKRGWRQRDRLDRYSSRSHWGSGHWTSILLWAIQQSSTTTTRSNWQSKDWTLARSSTRSLMEGLFRGKIVQSAETGSRGWWIVVGAKNGTVKRQEKSIDTGRMEFQIEPDQPWRMDF